MASSVIRIDTDASRNITGLAGGADGRIAILENVGAFNAVLKDESASSTASNRFDIGSDITIPPQGGATLRYDATLSRWYCIGAWLGSGSVSLVAGTTPITSGTNYTILIQDGSGNLGQVGPLADGEVLVGQTGTSPTARQPSGDWTWDSTAVATIANDAITTVKILDSNVTLAKIADIADQTILGNNTGGAAAPVALTAAQSRVVSRVDQMTTHGDSNYTILNTDRVVATSAALTTDRTWTLPAANTLNAGQFIIVADLAGGVTSANTLIIARDGTDTINGGTSLTIAAANNVAILISDGSSKWSGTLHSTAVGTVTQVTSSDSSLTVTNGTTTPDAVINVTHVNTWQVSQRFNYQCFDLYDTSNAYRIKVYTGESLTADRVLTLIINNANRNITLSGDLTVSASATISGTNTGDVFDTAGHCIILQDQKAQNTSGGTSTAGSWQTRTLNTEVQDTGNDCSLSSNQFTLTAGTYEVIAFAPAYASNSRNQLRIYNATDATSLVLGMNNFGTAYSNALLVGKFTVAASKALELQYRCETALATYGLGVETNWGTECYATVYLKRIS